MGRPKGSPRTDADIAGDAQRTGRPRLEQTRRDVAFIVRNTYLRTKHRSFRDRRGHGVRGYWRGCRCETCIEGYRIYMRSAMERRRKDGKQEAKGPTTRG